MNLSSKIKKIIATVTTPEAYNHVRAPSTEEKTLKNAINGDREAFEMLVRNYEKPLYGFIASKGIDEHTACDITQDAFIKAYQKISSFDMNRSSFKTWLFTIAFNVLRDRARHQKIKHREERKMADTMKNATFSGPEEQLASENAASSILAKLDDDIREIVQLRFLLGFSGTEISQMTGIPPGTIRSKLSRGFKKLQQHYSNQKGDL